MEAKDYLEKAGLVQVGEDGLSLIDVSRKLEAAFLGFIGDLKDKADPRWCAIARTHFEEGGMAIRKAIASFEPNQVKG